MKKNSAGILIGMAFWAAAMCGPQARATDSPMQQGPMQQGPMAQGPTLQGQLLRAEIDASYRQLRAAKTLSDRVGQPNDVSPVVDKYIVPGMSVAQALAILRAAGCFIDESRAGTIYARAAMKDGLLQVKHTWSVELGARDDMVDTISARIFTKYVARDTK